MTNPINNIFAIIDDLNSETNKLDNDELAGLFKFLVYTTVDLDIVEKCLVACPSNNVKLLYLRKLLSSSMLCSYDSICVMLYLSIILNTYYSLSSNLPKQTHLCFKRRLQKD
jgi:hypothetical protein